MTERWLYGDSRVSRALIVVTLIGAVVHTGAFVVDTGNAKPAPVPFTETTSFDLPDEDRLRLEERSLSIPRAQVFYSQYTYVVGYEGVERAVDALQQPEHHQQFGRPLTIYVSDYAGSDLALTDEGYLAPEREPRWVSADDAWFVVGSDAKTTVSEAIVPFSDEGAAHAFADEYGGEVLAWSAVRSYDVDLTDAAAVRETVPRLQHSADERVGLGEELIERDTSIVVGEDEPTVQAAVDAAPPNTTVLVPEGTYEEHIEIDAPVTLRGENATLRGNNSGTPITVAHDDVAVTGVTVTGVGDRTRPEDAEGRGEWDDIVDVGYGRSDAGIRVTNASRVYVHDVAVETPTSGVLLRDSTGVVVNELAFEGTSDPLDGFMGVLSIRSRVVVQNSVFDGGRDAVYLHRAPESVIRNNTFLGNRFGVHFMYTSDSLIADNVARNQTIAGITIMTSPARNAVVGNDIRHATDGILPGGSRSYVAENVVAYNGRGIMTGTRQSLYEHNVLYGNEVGMQSGSALPSNEIRANDFVANDIHAEAGIGPLRVWTDGDRGNYWDGAYGGRTGATLDRSYSPTDPVERRFHRKASAITLAESPTARALSEIRATSPGLRRGSIVDTAPLAEPASPEVLAELEDTRIQPTGGEAGEE